MLRLHKNPDLVLRSIAIAWQKRALEAEARIGQYREALEDALPVLDLHSPTLADNTRRVLSLSETPPPARFISVEGDARCAAIHGKAKAVCMLPRGHEGNHQNTQGYWMPQPGESFAAPLPAGGSE